MFFHQTIAKPRRLLGKGRIGICVFKALKGRVQRGPQQVLVPESHRSAGLCQQEKEIRRLKEKNEFLEEASAFFAASRRKSAKSRE